jgi:hypothetical protein
MLETLKRWMRTGRQADPAPADVCEIDSITQQGGELIGKAVANQLYDTGHRGLHSVGRHRPVILGYVAAMAESMARRLGDENFDGRYLAFFVLALEYISGDSSTALAATDECETLTRRKDVDYVRGGGMGKADFEILVQREEPQRLSVYLQES